MFAAIGLSARARGRVGRGLAVLLALPAAAFAITCARRLLSRGAPDPAAMGWVGLGALAVNLGSALVLAPHRDHPSGLMRAAFLSARNDVAASLGILLAGALTFLTRSMWPDLLVGAAIAWMNLDAAGEIWRAAGPTGAGADA